MENQTSQPRPPSSTTSNVVPSDRVSSKRKWWRKFKTFAYPLFKMDKGQWLEDMRGSLSMVAALMAAITFQAGLNPPGGVLQASTGPENPPVGCTSTVGLSVDENKTCPGEAVLGVVYPEEYFVFLWFNTFSFVGSLSAALLLVSGIPLRHRFPMWFLSITMCASLLCLAMTYLSSVSMLTPLRVYGVTVYNLVILLRIWIALLGLVILFFVLRFLLWVVRICRKLFKRLKN
ncbi:hypothetical protein L6164_031610 [Bauhinia variegata]|uniref:Uncharacterized protein n=1 Tax=Bauhinia variegata TaxID=167791 RepID=A0ACB9LGD8_BAUVA|nr:hypothetical protein L6164_031610 [Bauhinia variegata]